MRQKEARITALEQELATIASKEFPMEDILKEAQAAYPALTELTVNRNLLYSTANAEVDTALVAVVKFDGRVTNYEQQRFSDWVKARTKMDSVLVVVR